MSSAVADLEAGLQAMLALKPPGVSGSQIKNLTALCQANVQVREDSLHIILLLSANHSTVIVGVCPHSEAIHPLQESSWNSQAWRPLRRRLCNTQVG
jgi:hypothetical protein